jgi:hypothetical protein
LDLCYQAARGSLTWPPPAAVVVVVVVVGAAVPVAVARPDLAPEAVVLGLIPFLLLHRLALPKVPQSAVQ